MKPRIRTLLLYLTSAVVIIVAITIFYLNFAKKIDAAWFDDNWLYRKAVTVTVASSASDIASLETLITVDTTGITANLQTNCEDLRFTSQNGKLLPYYLDTCTDNSATNKIWVLVDLVPKNTTTYTMYMYYGNPTAVPGSDETKLFRVRGLKGYWTMNESSWTTNCSTGSVVDSSGYANSGKSCPPTTGPAGGAAGQYSNAGDFDGSNDYVFISDSTDHEPANITISAWVKEDVNGDMFIIEKHTSTPTDYTLGYVLRLNGDNSIQCYIGNGSSSAVAATGLSASTWYHVVCTYDGSYVRLYMDGVLSSTSSELGGNIGYTGVGALVFGNQQAGGSTWPFNGKLDDVRIYNRALPQKEITDLYNNPGTIASTATSYSQPSTAFATEEKGPGPIAYWSFNDGTGTAAQDSTVNNYDGTLINTPTWELEDMCPSGKCLRFSSSSSEYVTISDSSNFSPSASDLTISLWAKVPGAAPASGAGSCGGAGSYMISKGAASNWEWGLENDSNSLICFTAWQSDATNYAALSSSRTVNDSLWHYYTITFDYNTEIILYIDGKRSASTTSFTGSMSDGTQPVEIGRRLVSNYFDGFIDEVKIYPYVRTASQVSLDYLNSGINKGAGERLGSNPENAYNALNNGLEGYWKLEESSGNRSDSSGNSYTLTDGNTVTQNPGKFGYAGQFTRANSEYLSITESAGPLLGMSSTQSFTLSAWVFADSVASGDKIPVAKAETTTGPSREYYFLMNSGTTYFIISTDGGSPGVYCQLQWSGTMSASKWYHLMGWYNASTQTAGFEVNGTDTTTSSCAGPYDGNAPFRIGSASNAQAAISAWDGRVDEVRVYRRALSKEDRSILYNFAPGPVGYWKMEEVDGNRADSSGNGYTLSDVNTVTTKPGKYGKAGYFDANNGEYLARTDTADLSMGNLDFTVGVWVKLTSKADYRWLVFKGTADTAAGREYSLYYDNPSDVFAWSISNGTTATTVNATALGSPSANNWYYLTGWYDSVNDIAGISVNGTYTNTSSNTTGSQDTAGVLNVGSKLNVSHHYGELDELRIYRYVRNSKQIVEDMNAGHPAPGSPVGSPVGYWKMDEGYGTTIRDSTQYSATSNAFTNNVGWSQHGKFGKALAFDGTDDYVGINEAGQLDLGTTTDSYSVSAWINTQTDYSVNAFIVAKDDGSGATPFILYLDTSEMPNFLIADAGVSPSATGTTALNNGNWHHLVGVRNVDSDTLYLYVDGLLVDTTTDSTTATAVNNDVITIGNGAGSYNSRDFNGLIDEVKIYNSALTADQVKMDFNRGQAVKYGTLGVSTSDGKTASDSAATAYCVPGDTSTCNSPVAEWKFEESSGNANDSSGNENTLTNYNSATSQTGKFGKSFQMLSGSNAYLAAVDSSSLSSGDVSITWQVWSYLISTNLDRPLLYKSSYDATTLEYSSRFTANNYYQCYIKESSGGASKNADATNFGVPPIRTWHLISCVYDSSADTLKIYIDGKLDSTTTSVTGPADTTANLYLGQIAGVDYMDGRVDEARIYKYARTPAQIAYDYSRGAPRAYWKMDECQGATANDSSGNGNSGTIYPGSGGITSVGDCNTSSTMWDNGQSGKWNYSLDFDGTDDYVQFAANTLGTQFNNSAAITISAWVNLGSLPGNGLRERTVNAFVGPDQTGFYLGINDDSGTVEVGGRSGTGDSFQSTTVSLPNPTSTWHHLVGILDYPNDQIIIYIDGLLSQTTAATFANSIYTQGTPTAAYQDSIGATASTTVSEAVDGKIDDVKIFNYALTARQIEMEFNQRSAVRYGPLTGAP